MAQIIVNLSDSQAEVLRRLICRNNLLDCLSSEASEQDEQEFRINYGQSTRGAKAALEKLKDGIKKAAGYSPAV